MTKLVLTMTMSLDGFFSGPGGELPAGPVAGASAPVGGKDATEG
jgi:hypothetical protein